MKTFRLLLFLVAITASFPGTAQKLAPEKVLLFAYFKGNSDGLHLAASTNGLNRSTLKNDSIFLKPQLSPDNLFHMGCTVSWNAKGIGYANSPDLIHGAAVYSGNGTRTRGPQ